ncbi:MAG: nucleotidyltransferase [Deltaproteobacteria bacterium]|nr:nucleotidyltransferase [Deltaproteobacteria bacterium]
MKMILLAGGLGTRLKGVIGSIPKPMAPIVDSPFLEYLFTVFKKQGVKEFIVCTGHGGDAIRDYFGDGGRFGLSIRYTVERELLGTGGAIKLAEEWIETEHFLVTNGDTYFEVDLMDMVRFHESHKGIGTVALVHKEDPGRYGKVVCDRDNRITSFQEKPDGRKAGYINGGLYAFRKDVFHHIPENRVCSMEREILPSLIGEGLYGFPVEGYFIDIGVPEDYEKAKKELPLRRTP